MPDIAATPPKHLDRRAAAAWCLYDWANSGFPTVIVTFVFAAYFTTAVSSDPETGTAQWGYALSLSGIAIAVLSPILGAIADRSGRQLPWVGTFTVICGAATATLWLIQPDPAFAMAALVLFVLGNTAFEMGMVFYNAMLPRIAPVSHIGRLSGWGWGLGYAGGLACLVIALFAFVQTDTPLFGLDREQAEHVRIAGPLAAAWMAVFALPLFIFVREPRGVRAPPQAAIREGLSNLVRSVREARRYTNILRFLLARLFYVDGLNTMFAFGGIYAAGTFGMKIEEIILFGIALNISAGLGAVSFAWLDDKFGAKRTIMIALGGLILLGTPLLIAQTKMQFWALAVPLGLFMGPAQSASRSLLARLAPAELRNEMFGLFAMSGKVTAFLGPAILAWVTATTGSQRWGMATVVVFIAVGALLLLPVREERAS